MSLSPETSSPGEQHGNVLHFDPDRTPRGNQPEELFDEVPIVYYEEKTRIDGANIRYRVYEPSELTEETPIHIRNGFLGSGPTYYKLATELARLGRYTVVVESARTQLSLNAFHPDILRLQALACYAAMRDVSYWLGTPKADVVAHSMGGPVATAVATRHPERIRSISYTGAAGQDGHASMRHRLARVPHVIRKDIAPNIKALVAHPNTELELAIETAEYALLHPLRSLLEARKAATIDDRANMRHLKQLGVSMGAVLMEHDGFFDPNEVMRSCYGLFDHAETIPGAVHIDPNINPVTHARSQVEMLDTLNYATPFPTQRRNLQVVR